MTIRTFVSADGNSFAHGRFPQERIDRLVAAGFQEIDAPSPKPREHWNGQQWTKRPDPPPRPPLPNNTNMAALLARLRAEGVGV